MAQQEGQSEGDDEATATEPWWADDDYLLAAGSVDSGRTIQGVAELDRRRKPRSKHDAERPGGDTARHPDGP